MRLLLIHQNFPGQFRQLAPYLPQGHELVAICSHPRPIPLPIRILRYTPPAKTEGLNHFGASIWDEGLRRAEAVAFCVDGLLKEGWKPDCVLAHSGWGETIALPEFLPDVPQVIWPELWFSQARRTWCRPAQTLCGPCSSWIRSGAARVALDSAHSWILSSPSGQQPSPNFRVVAFMWSMKESIPPSPVPILLCLSGSVASPSIVPYPPSHS